MYPNFVGKLKLMLSEFIVQTKLFKQYFPITPLNL